MSGIYLHFPFCLKKCFYCDFYTSLKIDNKEAYLNALKKEIKIRKNYLNNDSIETIYFGGGTPGLMNPKEIDTIIKEIENCHTVKAEAEITVELNPDDVNEQYVKELRQTKINRISLGIQSFFDDDLKTMNRRHDANQSIHAVNLLKKAGYENISGDLIYGLPNMTLQKWTKNLDIFFDLNLVHLSAYHLTYEKKTVFYKYLQTGKFKEIDEELSRAMFETLSENAENNQFIHYETSNLGKEGFFSKHNTAYWQQKKYLGLGTSSHSFDKDSRQYNINNFETYIKALNKNETFFEKEVLSIKDKYNDYLITSLRTIWGIDLNVIKENYGIFFYEYLINHINVQIENKFMIKENNSIYLTQKAKFIEDTIIEKLICI
jgi:oxygen-independent coproporphyrinogen-3 oxidase